MIYFRAVRGIVNASKLKKIFPTIEIIKLRQFLQSLSLVNPLSEIPKSPINNIESKARVNEKINTVVIPVIIPI